MTDQQPENPAAPAPENATPTRIDGPATAAAEPADAPAVEPADETRAQGEPEPPARWSGSAVVPPHVPKRPWWSRRRTEGEADQPAPPTDPWADGEDWSATPAVDPWADQDTPWQAELPFPEAMPPTRMESALPPTRMEAPLPPTRMEAPLPPTRMDAPLPPTRMEPARAQAPPPGTRAPIPQAQAETLLRRAQAQQPSRAGAPAPAGLPQRAPAQAGLPQRAPVQAGPPRRRGWGRKKPTPQPVANRLPVQPRPPAPPPWAPPTRPPRAGPPPAPRRKRRWPRRLFLFTLFSVVCCCGVPAYLAWPAARQYPVSAVLPQTVADLDLREDAAGRRAVEKLSDQLGGTSLVQGEVFGGVYADGNGKRVTVFGTTGLRFTPEADVEAEIAHLAGEYDITDVQSYDLGESGVHERCGVGRSSGKTVVVCAWADHGSLATVLLTRRSVPESAELTGVLRGAVLTRG
ncbi:hypothetical protein [Actinoplanes sp. NPDC049599]|uniref:hypothetical protein n=1 Tax=Actinoplanes sp. NPDC049599 TaxID=3363903 RepID=UPI00378EF684